MSVSENNEDIEVIKHNVTEDKLIECDLSIPTDGKKHVINVVSEIPAASE